MAGNQAGQTWQAKLVARYPLFFHVITEQGRTHTPGGPTCGDGWRELVETAVGRIADALAAAPPARVVTGQSRKNTRLCACTGHGKDLDAATERAVKEAVALAEARSACTCETCGKPGRLFKRGGWYLTACDEHAKGDLVPAKPGFENVHIVRTVDAGRIRIVSCRRYIRETDTFVDIDPHSLGIEE